LLSPPHRRDRGVPRCHRQQSKKHRQFSSIGINRTAQASTISATNASPVDRDRAAPAAHAPNHLPAAMRSPPANRVKAGMWCTQAHESSRLSSRESDPAPSGLLQGLRNRPGAEPPLSPGNSIVDQRRGQHRLRLTVLNDCPHSELAS
jgi:hypothetical protein